MSEGRGDAEPSGPGSAEANPSRVVFRVQPGFQFFYSLPVLLALAILVDALLAPAADKWLFLALVLAMSLISVPRGWSKVTLDDAQVTLITPLRRPRPVSLHRLAAFEPSPVTRGATSSLGTRKIAPKPAIVGRREAMRIVP